MDERLADMLDECLARLGQGATIDDCLRAFADQRAQLEPALRAAVRMSALPRPAMPAATRAKVEQGLLALAARRREAQAPRSAAPPARPIPSWRALGPEAILAGSLRLLGYRGRLAQPWLRLATLGVAVVLALVLSAGAFAAARAIVQITQPRPTAEPTNQPAALLIDGRIEQIAQERWVVGGRPVLLTTTTAITGTPALGALAHVRGSAVPGGLLAKQIVIEPLAATPTAVPSAAPSATETPTATTAPTAPPTSTGLPITTAVPAPSVPAPAPPARPTAAPNPAPPGPSNDQQHTCNGQQRGREDKKCDPKPQKHDEHNDPHDKDKKDKKHG